MSLLVSALALAPLVPASDVRVDFEAQVLPILSTHCFSCHAGTAAGGPRKPKGELRLDGAGWILTGGAGGAVVVPAEPEASSLYELVSLDADDPDVMPAKGELLSPAEIRVLREWIDQGASFGGWVGAAGPMGAKVGTRTLALHPDLLVFRTLGQEVPGVETATLSRLRSRGLSLQEVLPDSPLLSVGYLLESKKVDDELLNLLQPISRNIAVLRLPRSKITDRSLALVGEMPNLVQLDLSQTRVTDGGIKKLKGLEHLRSLNLFGTAVGDPSLRTSARLASLRDLYVWQTKVTQAAVDDLKRERPGLGIRFGEGLPGIRSKGSKNRRGQKPPK